MSFQQFFSAAVNSDWGYLTYRLNGEKVYRNEFKKSGYKVPYFCNSDDYDKNEFSIIYLQGRARYGNDIKKAVSETQKNIKEINSSYSP